MKKLIFSFVTLILISLSVSCYALDTDDGIPIDDSIEEYDTIDKIQNNISYTIRYALSRANMTIDNSVITDSSNISAVNSVTLSPGSYVEGDIVIIDQSEGGSVAISR
ncbi:MAG: hypothetical protein D3904_02815 [Candidatus Electrothrix sp. EH2]|jgi:hypothetical protein|nr:hypothetical protein [Candidatus Electrothrix sp. EH2]